MKIAISITTHNRYEVFKETYDNIIKFLPEGASLIIIDDASYIPVQEATFRFEENAGIAKSKNMAFELMGDADYYFCFDDDCYPKVKNWHLPYIDSGLNHAMMIFPTLASGEATGNRLFKTVGNLRYFNHPCGCMLFFTKKCLEVVGGMNEVYGVWGFDHPDLSMRIFNNGLTPHPFLDVQNSLSLFHSHDYYQTCKRSVDASVRKKMVKKNTPIYELNKKSKEFIPYKPMTGRIITTYFTGVIDPQIGITREFDPLSIFNLEKSLHEKDVPLTIIGNFVKNDAPRFVRDECLINPYLQRWVSILEYFKEVKEDYVFCVDATDVEMLKNPFKENLGNYLWVGDEPSTINNEWLLKHHKEPLFESFFKTHKNNPLLNAGVIGGRKCVVEAFLTRLVWYIQNYEINFTDMALFNYVLYTEFSEQVRHGRKVTTVFKAYDTVNKHNSWWKHK
jgi:glycosyltransferase involved in cell wall biosynthesis